MWTSGLVKVAHFTGTVGRMMKTTRCKIMVEYFWAVPLRFIASPYVFISQLIHLLYCFVTPWLIHPPLCVEQDPSDPLRKTMNCEAPKMTKDDYLKLAPVGAAFAAGQVWCSPGQTQWWMLLLKTALNLLFWLSIWSLPTIKNIGGSTNQP